MLRTYEPVGRGRDLQGEFDDSAFLIESHGLPERNKKALYSRGFEDLEVLDEWLLGIAVNEYHGYETYDGFEEQGASPYEDPHGRIAQLSEQLERREIMHDEELKKQVLDHLEDLGYA